MKTIVQAMRFLLFLLGFLLLVQTHYHKQLMEEGIYFSLHTSDHTPSLKEVRAGTQNTRSWRQQLKKRPNREAVQQLVCSLLAYSVFLFIPRAHTLQQHHPQWAELSDIPHQGKKKKKKPSHRCPHRPILWRFSQLSYPSLRRLSFLPTW